MTIITENIIKSIAIELFDKIGYEYIGAHYIALYSEIGLTNENDENNLSFIV